MLRNTYIHINGLSKAYEKRIWKHGVDSWENALEKIDNLPLNSNKKELLKIGVEESTEMLNCGNYRYFSNLLPTNEHWRAYPEFSDSVAYLDIETTGPGRYNEITVVGIYDGKKKEAKTFVKGIDLDLVPEELSKYKMLVTYNGACFDLPCIMREFPEIDLNKTHFHVDLRYPLNRIGYKGGLKKIEREMGIRRPDELEGVDGFEAVRLWKRYKIYKDEKALEKLLMYNKEDIINLELIIEKVYPQIVDEYIKRMIK
ncbi:MAG: exonuclease [Methanosarcinaceae archaeon]|nr:exonuclease [Methanosarcinaceae archaeon]